MDVPADLEYTEDHEWLRVDAASSIATIGITEHAACKLGDVVFLELPAVGSAVTAGTVAGEIESTKSVGELVSPVDGTVVEVNESAVASPETVNADPFGGGWLIKVEFSSLPDGLMTADDYAKLIGE